MPRAIRISRQKEVIPVTAIAQYIRLVRNQRVILDSDLAKLYQVPTKRLNEQFRRNPARFPEDFAFQLTHTEWLSLRSGATISKSEVVDYKIDATNWSQIATSSQRHRRSGFLPFAFTEHGALMVAN